MLHLWNLDAADAKDQPVLLAMHAALEPYVEQGFLLANFQVPGSSVQDCDAIFAAILKPETSLKGDVVRHGVRNIVLLIEIKQHSEFEVSEGAIRVRYADKPALSNATRQLTQSSKAFIGYLQTNQRRFGLEHIPFVYRLLYFPNADPSGQEHPLVEANALLKGQFDLVHISQRAAKQSQRPGASFGVDAGALEAYQAFARSFESRSMRPTRLDRARVEQLSQKTIQDNAQYIEKLGQQLLVFKGQAGTGKTTRLLSLARKIHELGQSATLFTFNRALAVDIRRMIDLYRKSAGPFPLPVSTISSILYLAVQSIASPADLAVLEKAQAASYEAMESELERILRAAMSGPESQTWRELLMEGMPALNADFFMVDEGQDWSDLEIQFLRWMAGSPERLIVAQGPDQKTRRYSAVWDDLAPRARRQIIACQVNLRQKPALHRFNRALSELLGEDWTSTGMAADAGRIEFLPDARIEDPGFWKKLLSEKELEPIDIIAAEPSHKGLRKTAEILGSFSIPAWEFAAEKRTGIDPAENQIRILPYESMRGLESWVVILRAIDYEAGLLKSRLKSAQGVLISTLEDQEAADREILRQLRIATTRPIDTLIITSKNPDHRIVKTLKELAGTG